MTARMRSRRVDPAALEDLATLAEQRELLAAFGEIQRQTALSGRSPAAPPVLNTVPAGGRAGYASTRRPDSRSPQQLSRTGGWGQASDQGAAK